MPLRGGDLSPAATAITSDYQTVMAFEKRKLTKDQVVAELDASFMHLHQAMGLTVEQVEETMVDGR